MSSTVTSGSLMSRFLPFSGHHQQQAAAAAQRHHRQSSASSSSSSSSDEADATGAVATPYRIAAADEIAIVVADQWTTSAGFSKKAAVSSRASTCSASSSVSSSSEEDERNDRYMAAAIAFAEEVSASIYRPSYDFDSDAECSTSASGTAHPGSGLKRVASSVTSSATSSRKVSAAECCQKPASNSLIPSCSVAYSTMMFNNNNNNNNNNSYNNNGWSSCTHVNRKNGCAVEARQIEMEFVTLSARPYQLQITAPNGERSARFAFKAYAQRAIFSPRRTGCGHGLWTIETAQLDANNKKTVNKESIFLDGVGSLFFSIDEHLRIRLVSQEFLRLPSASQ